MIPELDHELQKLKTSFPMYMEGDVADLFTKIQIRTEHIAQWGHTMMLDHEEIELPYRLYWEEQPMSDLSSLTSTQKTMLACILTRHHNGFIREKNLKQILPSKHNWTMPFLVQLMGEYIVEILDVIWANFHQIDEKNLRAFLHENEEYWSVTKQRINSYWDVYHREKYPEKSNYTGIQIVDRIEEEILLLNNN